MVAQAIRGHVRRVDLEPVPDRRRTGSASGVMLAALDHGPVARSTIARLTGLSPAAVSRQCAELIRRGLLREAPSLAAGKPTGRPHVPVDVDVAGPVACGVHIALRHSTSTLVDLRGRVVARERVPHRAVPAADGLLASVAERLPEFTAQAGNGARLRGRRQVLGIGVATGGWVDPDAGAIVDHPLLGWRDVAVREPLERRTGLPVRVDGHSARWPGPSSCSAISGPGQAWCTCSWATWWTRRSRSAALCSTARGRQWCHRAPAGARQGRAMRLRPDRLPAGGRLRDHAGRAGSGRTDGAHAVVRGAG